MSKLLDEFEDQISRPGRLTRRRMLGRLAKASLAIVAAVAGAAIPITAFACRQVVCCCLEYSSNCSWCTSGRTCADCNGISCYSWQCTSGSCTYTCIDCQEVPNPDSGANCSCASFAGGCPRPSEIAA